jgi:proteasome lid subunit RPN8/RPN11
MMANAGSDTASEINVAPVSKVTLKMSRAVYTQLRAHGEETYPHECCGVLLGHALDGTNQVVAAVRAGNTRTDSAHNRYHIAPQELVSIQRQARERELDIVGFYHSHPDHPARWSVTDFNEAHWLGCSYVITSVEGGVARQTNSFYLAGTGEDDKRFEDEAVEIAVVEVVQVEGERCRPSAP